MQTFVCLLPRTLHYFLPLQLLENMTEVVRKGILQAELQLQKANEDKLMEEVSVFVCVCVSVSTYIHIKCSKSKCW